MSSSRRKGAMKSLRFMLLVCVMMLLSSCGTEAPTNTPVPPVATATTAAAAAPTDTTAPAAPTATTAAAAAPTDTTAPAAPTGTTASTGGKKPVLALIQGVKGDAFYITMEKGARAKADELGAELIVDGPPEFNAVQQTPIVDAMIARKVDVLIIAATDKQAMIQPLQRANDAGIKVISVDTFIGDGDYVKGPVTFPLSYIGSDNTQGGKIACDALIKSLGGKGKVYIQNVKPGISTTDQREQGCKDSITASNGAVTLVGVDYNDDSSAKAAEQTAAVLQRTPDLGAVFGTNLFSARGAAQAIKNANLQGTVKVANFDAPEDAVADLRAGTNDMVIAQEPALMGSTAVQYAIDALNGNMSAIQKRVATGYVVITRDNVDTPEAQAAIYKSSVDNTTAPTATTGAGGGKRKPVIALIQGVKGDAFYITMQKGAQAKADELGAELIVDGPPEFNAVQQTPIVDAMIARKVDVLIIAATDKQAMIQPLQRANDAGIKVISVDTFIGDGDYAKGPVTFPLSYIGSDNTQGGKIACDSLIKSLGGKGKIYIQNV